MSTSIPTSPSHPRAESPDSDLNSLASLPDSAESDSIDDIEDSDQRLADAEREWKESLQQLELLLTMVVVPYLGKYFGRKCAFWVWGRFMSYKYPVEVVITHPKTFKIAGALEAAATL